MNLPGRVEQQLSTPPLETVPIGTEDLVVVTPNQTIEYRTAGLCCEAQIEEYEYHGQKIALSKGHRKATISLAGPATREQQLIIPADYTEPVLKAVIAGTLCGTNGITESPRVVERSEQTTLVVTDDRLLIYDGNDVWGKGFECYTPADIEQLEVTAGGNQLYLRGAVNRSHDHIRGSPETIRKIKQIMKTQPETDAGTAHADKPPKLNQPTAAAKEQADLLECLDTIQEELQTLQRMLKKKSANQDRPDSTESVSHDR